MKTELSVKGLKLVLKTIKSSEKLNSKKMIEYYTLKLENAKKQKAFKKLLKSKI